MKSDTGDRTDIPAIDWFEPVGGHPALDAVNTVHSWSGNQLVEEYMHDFAGLVQWHRRFGLIDERQAAKFRAAPEQAAGQALSRFRKLRGELHTIFAAVASDASIPTAGLAALDQELRRTQQYRRLVERDSGVTFEWVFSDAPPSAVCGVVAWQAADLLINGPLDRVKECPPPDGCGWLFLDTSRNRSRHWCSMKTCGNTAKVRRFRARHSN